MLPQSFGSAPDARAEELQVPQRIGTLIGSLGYGRLGDRRHGLYRPDQDRQPARLPVLLPKPSPDGERIAQLQAGRRIPARRRGAGARRRRSNASATSRREPSSSTRPHARHRQGDRNAPGDTRGPLCWTRCASTPSGFRRVCKRHDRHAARVRGAADAPGQRVGRPGRRCRTSTPTICRCAATTWPRLTPTCAAMNCMRRLQAYGLMPAQLLQAGQAAAAAAPPRAAEGRARRHRGQRPGAARRCRRRRVSQTRQRPTAARTGSQLRLGRAGAPQPPAERRRPPARAAAWAWRRRALGLARVRPCAELRQLRRTGVPLRAQCRRRAGGHRRRPRIDLQQDEPGERLRHVPLGLHPAPP